MQERKGSYIPTSAKIIDQVRTGSLGQRGRLQGNCVSKRSKLWLTQVNPNVGRRTLHETLNSLHGTSLAFLTIDPTPSIAYRFSSL
jgi:hypothetical protein